MAFIEMEEGSNRAVRHDRPPDYSSSVETNGACFAAWNDPAVRVRHDIADGWIPQA